MSANGSALLLRDGLVKPSSRSANVKNSRMAYTPKVKNSRMAYTPKFNRAYNISSQQGIGPSVTTSHQNWSTATCVRSNIVRPRPRLMVYQV